MSLLDRMSDDLHEARMNQDAVAEAQSLEDAACRQERADIVTEHVRNFAASLGEDYVELPPLNSARYFAVGGLVLAVRERSNIPKEQRLITDSRDVLWQHTVALVGVDVCGKIREGDRTTLLLVVYGTLVEAYQIGQRNLIDFDHARVVSALYPTPN